MNNRHRTKAVAKLQQSMAFLLLFYVQTSIANEKPFVVALPRGHYADTINDVYLAPFAKETNLTVKWAEFQGDLDTFDQQPTQNNEAAWDVVDLPYAEYLQACDEGLLQPIEPSRLLPAPDGTLANADFIDDAIGRCGVAHVVTSNVIAFNPNHFPFEKPSELKDLFDIERFPGKRALPHHANSILEWALLSYDVPRGDLYNLLSTERGLDLAFSRLQAIKPHVMWWQDETDAVQWLAQGDVVMATASNGVLFDAAIKRNLPVAVIWDGQIYDYRVWAIPIATTRPELSMTFIRFATDIWRMADLASYIAYGPTRRSASNLVWTHFGTGVDMRPHMPNQPTNLSTAVRMDHEWYASIGDQLSQRFEKWLAEKPNP